MVYSIYTTSVNIGVQLVKMVLMMSNKYLIVVISQWVLGGCRVTTMTGLAGEF